MNAEAAAVKGTQRFTRAVRLGKNRNFRYVYRKGKSYPSKHMTLVFLKGRYLKLGFSVSSKVGNAVTRNRLRRYMREDMRKTLRALKRGSYIFVARPSLKDLTHDALTKEMYRLIESARLFRDTGGAVQ